MINIKNKHNCCGCESCIQVCPKNCINLNPDKEGFLYPTVETSLCVKCGLCEKVCPVINIQEINLPKEIWAAQNNDAAERRESSSGGVTSMLARKIIEDGGVVFGVIINEKCEVVHTYAETQEELIAFRGSKYVQSRVGHSFKQVKEFLHVGRKVLFVGTPCQVSGLKLFLRKDYPNLYTIDFICHGVPSPGIFKWYLQEKLNKYAGNPIPSARSYNPQMGIQIPNGIKIKDIRFRDKKEGWKKYSFVLSFTQNYDNGKSKIVTITENVTKNAFLKGFCTDLYLRPSCHQCPTRGFRSGSDLTLADFWGQEVIFPDFDNDTGVSSVIIKNEKGLRLFHSISDIKKERRTIEEVLTYNPSLLYSKSESYKRRKFWKNIDKYSFERNVQISNTLNLIERVFVKLKGIL